MKKFLACVKEPVHMTAVFETDALSAFRLWQEAAAALLDAGLADKVDLELDPLVYIYSYESKNPIEFYQNEETSEDYWYEVEDKEGRLT